MAKRKKNKGAVCKRIRKSSAAAIKKAPAENHEEVVAEIESQRDALLEKNGCQ